MDPIVAYRVWNIAPTLTLSYTQYLSPPNLYLTSAFRHHGTRWRPSTVHRVIWPQEIALQAVCATYGLDWYPYADHYSICGTSDQIAPCSPTVVKAYKARKLRVPASCGTCGIYAYNHWKHFPVPADPNTTDPIRGSVLLWGKMYEHERGWRAQFGKPLELYRPWDATEGASLKIERLSQLYGLPILEWPHRNGPGRHGGTPSL